MKPAIILYAFVFIAFLQMFGIFNDYTLVKAFSLPLLMPLLALYAYYYTNKKPEKTIKYIIISLVFSWFGDLFLMIVDNDDLILLNENQDGIFFLMGLVSFLIAHLFYISVFILEVKGKGKAALLKRPLAALPVIIAYALLLLILLPQKQIAEDLILKIALIIYATVISVMVITTLNRYKKVVHSSFVMVFFGAAIFMLSDSLIALDAFHDKIPNAAIYIMFTYLLGQFLIVKGSLANT